MDTKTVKILEAGINDALGGPRGDPDRNNLYPAACMVVALMQEGHKVEDYIIKNLRSDNMYGHDFIEEVEQEFEL